MKLKVLAATIAAISAVSAGSAVAGTFIAPSKYLATKDPCLVNQGGNGTTTGSLTTAEANAAMPLYCRPEVILYIGGASAPALAVTLALPPAVFEGTPFGFSHRQLRSPRVFFRAPSVGMVTAKPDRRSLESGFTSLITTRMARRLVSSSSFPKPPPKQKPREYSQGMTESVP